MAKGQPNMKRGTLLPDDAKRQLPLLATPAVRLEVPLVELEEPLPDCVWQPVGLHRQRATCDKPQGTRDLVAVLRVHGEIGWMCMHAHQTRDGALACAHQARHYVRAPQE
jgi:hypothetical protein